MQKKRYHSVCILLLSAFASCQSQESNDLDKKLEGHLSTSVVNNPRSLEQDSIRLLGDIGSLNFADTSHDFGTLKENEVVQFEFAYENKGKKDLFIHDSKASCGCTVAEFSKKPIKPNEKGSIKVSFDSKGKEGYNERAVLITTNGNPAVYKLTIIANVE